METLSSHLGGSRPSDRFPFLGMLIPCHSELDLLEKKLKSAISFPYLQEILVSVSNPDSAVDYRRILEMDPRIRLNICPQPTGLYENFGRLLTLSRSKHVFFSPLDDDHPKELLSEALDLLLQSPETDLLVLPFVEQEWSKKNMGWIGPTKKGPFPTEISNRRQLQAIYSQASWFFGVWNREFLMDSFPKKPFDWLDAFCVSKAIMKGTTLELRTLTLPITIGTREGPSHSVGTRHRPTRSLTALFRLLRSSVFLNPVVGFHFAMVLSQRLSLAKKLNQELTRGSDGPFSL